MKESIKMEDYDGFPWRSTKVERTKILPLRWISNWLGSIATDHLVKGVYLDEDNNYGWRYKYHAKMWKYLNKPYEKWGTYYSIDMKALKRAWDQDPEHQELMRRLTDYNEDGIPYWDKE
jgi:hypothetical protein